MSQIKKIAIIGVGYVGASIAYALMLKKTVNEIVLIDVNAGHANGEMNDIIHGIPYMGVCTVYQGDYRDCINCDIIIITAGKNRKIGQTRLDLVNDNIEIMKDVIQNIIPYYTNSVIIVVSNPVDILTYKVAQWMNLKNGSVLGTGCILDTSRLVRVLSEHTGIAINNIQAMVVGEHGEHQVPLWSRVSVANTLIEEYCEMMNISWNATIQKNIVRQVKEMGAKIIAGKGRTHYGIATCVCYIVDVILNHRTEIMPVSSVLSNEYMGIKDVALTVPSVVGDKGVQFHLPQNWTNSEIKAFQESAVCLQEILKQIENI